MRGCKRQVKRLEQRKNQLLARGMDRQYIETHGYFELQVMDICPGLGPVPPTWFNKRIVQALLEIYQVWHKQAKEWVDELFYLKVWLFDPGFYRSRLVFGLNKEGYDQLFDRRVNQKKSFPYQRLGDSQLHRQLDWQLFIHSYDCEENDLDEIYTKKQVEKIKRNTYRVLTYEFDSGPERVYRTDVGDVWIGSMENVK